VLNYATSRDVAKIYPGKSAYACMLNDAGHFIEDCILYRTGPNSWMVVHGSGAGHETLTSYVIGRNTAVIVDDDLHDLSLQGPIAVDFLAKHVPGIRDLKYFHHLPTTLFGRPVLISRTGYTGERGYEIFCKGEDAGLIWDTILSEGKSMGIVPACFTTLDYLRVESSLLFYPYDMSQMYPFEHDPPVGVGARFHGKPRQERFPRRRRAYAPQGQGAVQDFRFGRRRQISGRHG
jgi:aminomethyltransferase